MTDLKALATRFYDDVFGGGDTSLIDELVADDFVEHEATPGVPPDKAGLKAFLEDTHAAFSDFSVETVALAVEGDEVWAQGIMRGTHTGDFMGIPATGRSIEVSFFDRVKVRDGKAVEHWGVTDFAALMEQLGLIETPG